MGLIKAALGAAGSVLADQWKEYFYCDSMSDDVLMCKAQKRSYDRVVAKCEIGGVSIGELMRAQGVAEGGEGR